MTSLSAQLRADPTSFVEARYDEAFNLSREELDEIHLHGLQKRFNELRPRLAVLDALAKEQGIEHINHVDDAVPLLFPHTVYKSYPLSLLERSRFDRLTHWLAGMTTTDLSGVDASDVHTIDDWIALIEKTTEIQLLHTSGTTGKLSFIPRTRRQWDDTVRITANSLRDWHGAGAGPDVLKDHMPLVIPAYRYGASSSHRGVDRMVRMYAGGDDNALFLYPGAYYSADVASLAGRLKAAESRGEQGKLQLSPALLARREEFAVREGDRPEQMRRFFEAAVERYAGKDVILFAVWPILFEWAEAGLARGLSKVFGPNSVLITGGGSKGRVLPDNYRQQIFDFIGFSRYYEYYSMSEIMAGCPRCDEGNFHIPPTMVPYVLDPDTGAPMPRSGRHTGRFGLMDLLPDSYWGGLITGDEVTLSGWDEPCACGRHGPYLHSTIGRFSEKQGGDDKINCAGAPEAHDKAIDYLLQQTQG